MLESFALFLAKNPFVQRYLFWAVAPCIARGYLIRKWGIVMAGYLEFFPTRALLEQKRPIEELFAKASKDIYGILVTGRKVWSQEMIGREKIKQLILPDPKSESFKNYAASVNEQRELVTNVCRATKINADRNIEVRWYPEFIHASVFIGDPERNNGWVHIEPTLPYTTPNLRHSYTFERGNPASQQAMNDHWSMFKKMWAASKKADMRYVKDVLGSS